MITFTGHSIYSTVYRISLNKFFLSKGEAAQMSGAQEAACAAAVAEGISSVLKSTVEEIDSRVTSLR